MGCNKSNRKDIKTEVKQNKSFQIPQEKTKAKHKTQNTKQKNTQITKPTMPEKKKTQSNFKEEEEELTKISSVDPKRKKEKEKEEEKEKEKSQRSETASARRGLGEKGQSACVLSTRRLSRGDVCRLSFAHRESGRFEPPDPPSHQINGHKCDKTE
jgi:outer membrane biosynthesis protein TonB